MIPTFAYVMPSQKQRFALPDGTADALWWYFIWAMYNRGGGQSGVIDQVENAIAAAGASQATAYQLSRDYSEVLQGAGGVVLANLQPGQRQWVFNGTGGNINVYPFLNANAPWQIDALGINQPYILANGKTQRFTAFSTTQARSLQLG